MHDFLDWGRKKIYLGNKQKDLNIFTYLETAYCPKCDFVVFKGYVFLRGIYWYTKKASTSDPLASQKHCSVCLKKNNKIGIKCSSCKQNVKK